MDRPALAPKEECSILLRSRWLGVALQVHGPGFRGRFLPWTDQDGPKGMTDKTYFESAHGLCIDLLFVCVPSFSGGCMLGFR